MKHYSTQELLNAGKNLPQIVQDAPSSELTITTIQKVADKFQLSADQVRLLAELNVQILLGLIEPKEFLPALIEGGVSAKDARDIAVEIKQKILDPLQKELEVGEGKPAETKPTTRPPTPVVSAAPAPKPPPPQVPVPSYAAPPLQSPRYVRTEPKASEAYIAAVPPRGATRPAITLGVEPAVHAPQPMPAPAAPGPEALPKPAAPAVVAHAPTMSLPTVAHKELPVGEEAPVVSQQEPVVATPAPTPPLAQTQPPVPPPTPPTPPPPARASYAADPYREPIEP